MQKLMNKARASRYNNYPVTRTRIPTPSVTLQFIMSNKHNANRIAYTCLMRCNDDQNDHYQSCAYYLSALVAALPVLDEETATDVMTWLGYNLQKIDEAGFDAVGFNLQPAAIDDPKIRTMMGQVIFIAFLENNITSDQFRYIRLMQERTNAIKAHVGLNGPLLEGSSSDIVISFSKAKALRQILGGQHKLRPTLLRAMLGLRSDPGPVGRMCSYICDMLCWTDMSLYLCIKQTLCQTKSPVLSDLSIRYEVDNLYHAFVAIRGSEYPQYFRILNPYCVTAVMERSQFPSIAAVAQSIRAERFSSAPRRRNSPLVDRLVAMHKAYMERHGPNNVQRLQFSYDDEDGEGVISDH